MAASVWLYPVFGTPGFSVSVATARGGLTAMLNCLVAVLSPLSVARIVKLKVPVAEVVPEIVPVALFRVNPVGRLPAVIDQVYDDGMEVDSCWVNGTPG